MIWLNFSNEFPHFENNKDTKCNSHLKQLKKTYGAHIQTQIHTSAATDVNLSIKHVRGEVNDAEED